MLNKLTVAFVITASFYSCDKVDLPSGVEDCMILHEFSEFDEIGHITYFVNDTTYTSPFSAILRENDMLSLAGHNFDETCYKHSYFYIDEVPLYSENTGFIVDPAKGRCNTEIDAPSSFFNYYFTDHDALLSLYVTDPQRSDYSVKITDFNEKRDIVRGTIYGVLYRDISCDSTLVQDSLIVSGSFEAPLIR